MENGHKLEHKLEHKLDKRLERIEALLRRGTSTQETQGWRCRRRWRR